MRRHRPRALRTDGATFRFASAGWTRRPAPSVASSSPAVGAAAGGFACTRASGESGSVGASAPAPGTGAGPLGAPRPRPRGSAREPGPGGASLGGRFGRGWWVAGRRRGLGRAGERRHRKSGRAALGGDTALFRVASSWRARGPARSARLLRRSLEVRGERWRGRWLEDRLEASRRTVALEAEGDGGDRPPADPLRRARRAPGRGFEAGQGGSPRAMRRSSGRRLPESPRPGPGRRCRGRRVRGSPRSSGAGGTRTIEPRAGRRRLAEDAAVGASKVGAERAGRSRASDRGGNSGRESSRGAEGRIRWRGRPGQWGGNRFRGRRTRPLPRRP